MKKKFQVFISSTYIDLEEERQVAVSAILNAGHIPAGMELFKAGNESQWTTIKKWIDDSDIFLLILGGRYGSIEDSSGKSYIELEYQYATGKGKPVFALVLEENYLKKKSEILKPENIFEQTNVGKYNAFKEIVMSKMINKIYDVKDIAINIHPALNEIAKTYDLSGWVRTVDIIQEDDANIENQKLHEKINVLNKDIVNLKQQKKFTIEDLTYEEIKKILSEKEFLITSDITESDEINRNALELFVQLHPSLCTGLTNKRGITKLQSHIYYRILPYYMTFGLLDKVKITGVEYERIQMSKAGMKFYARLEVEKSEKK